MADMNFQLVLQAIVKGQEALDKVVKAEEQIAKAAKAANDAQAAGAGKAESAMRREAEASQRAATSARALGTATHAAASGNSQQAASAERVASAETRAASATKAHAAAATMQAKAVHTAARAQTGAVASIAAGAAAARATARKEMLAAAATEVAPSGYLLGAGAAVATGAALGMTVGAGVGVMAYGLKQAMTFEKAMADVKKKVDLPAGAKWEDVERMIYRTSLAVGLSAEKTAGLAADASAAGIAFEDLGRFTMLTAKAASAWDMSTEDAATKLANLKTQTRMSIPELQDLGDVINTLADTSNSREADIVNMLERSFAAAKAAGVPLKTTLAMMTALNSGGMAPERASTFFNAFTSTLATAAQGGRGAKDAAEGFKALGLSAKAVEKGMKTDATKTMIDVLDRLDKASDKAAIGVKIFGKQWWDEAARGGQALAEVSKNLNTVSDPANYRGSLDKNLALDLATTSKQLERFNAMVSQIGAGLMSWALPPINEQLQKIIKSFQTMKETGFLAGKDGGPIERLKDKTPVPFSPENRARFMPRGVAGYEHSLGLDRPIPKAPPKPMFQQIEGVTPHINVKQIDTAVSDGVAGAQKLHDALETLNMTVTPNVNAGPAIHQLQTLTSVAQSAKAALTALGASGPGTAPAFAAPAAAGVGKQSRLSLPATGVIASRGGLKPTHVAHGGTTVHYAPTVHVAGGDAKTFRDQLREHAHEVASLVRREEGSRARLNFREVG